MTSGISHPGTVEALRRVAEASRTGLHELDLSDLVLFEVPSALLELTQLSSLDLSNNRISKLPAALSALTSLNHFYLDGNELRELPESIGELKQLFTLSIQNNQLRTLPDSIGGLECLEELDLRYNELVHLPASLDSLKELQVLRLQGNIRLGLPPEVLTGTAAGIIDYYLRMRSGSLPLREVKLIMVGRGEVGKTSLVETLQGMPFTPGKQIRTDGIAITRWPLELSDGKASAVVWDFGGQEIMHGTHQFFLTHRSIYIVVLDARHDRQHQDAEYWLRLVRAFGGDSPVLVVMNKQNSYRFDTDRQLLIRKYKVPTENFYPTDCTDSESIGRLRAAICKEMGAMLVPAEYFPQEWWKVKRQLEAMLPRGEEYLSDERYRQICETHGIVKVEKDVPAILIQRLTELGTVVSFPDEIRLNELTVLNPEWVTDGIYRVITDGELRAQGHGQLDIGALKHILPVDRWPPQRHSYLIDLMVKFELCFPLEGVQHVVLVPELLADVEPRLPDWDPRVCVVFLYKYSVLPHGILPRFITRTHARSNGQPRWRKGVVLAQPANNVAALIRADYEANVISVYVRGTNPSDKRGLLAVVRDHFDIVHERVKGLDVQELLAVPGHPDVTVSYRDMLLDEKAGRRRYRVTIDGIRRDLSVSDILDGVDERSRRAQKNSTKSARTVTTNISIYGDSAQVGEIMGDTLRQEIRGGVFYGPVSQKTRDLTLKAEEVSDQEARDLLQKLIMDVEQLRSQLPEDKLNRVNRQLTTLTEEVASGNPETEQLTLSGRYLIEAAKASAELVGPITTLVRGLSACFGVTLP
jgi:internalin A